MIGPITGTFIDEITYDIPSSNWTKRQWKRDLDNMKKVGIDTLIFIRGGFYGKTIYPSSYFHTENTDDFAGFILEEALCDPASIVSEKQEQLQRSGLFDI